VPHEKYSVVQSRLDQWHRYAIGRHLKHPIDHAHMKMHMGVEAGAEAMDEVDCADASMGLVYVRCTRTMAVQMALQHAQKDA